MSVKQKMQPSKAKYIIRVRQVWDVAGDFMKNLRWQSRIYFVSAEGMETPARTRVAERPCYHHRDHAGFATTKRELGPNVRKLNRGLRETGRRPDTGEVVSVRRAKAHERRAA